METKTKKEVTPVSTTGGLFSFDEFDNFFTDFLSHKWPRTFEWNFPVTMDKNLPKVDVIDHDKEIEVQAALPGVKKEDLELTVSEQAINIRVTTKKTEKKEEERYFRREILHGEYLRTLPLPANVDSEHAKAVFRDGLLKVTIPKTEKSPRMKVSIQ